MACAVVALGLLGACGTLPQRVPPPRTAAKVAPVTTPLANMAQLSQPAPELSGFRLMPLGLYSLDARIQLAQRAHDTLDVQYYQIHNDNTGRLLLLNLRDAAHRGVRVRLIVDDLYTTGGDAMFRGLAAHDNIEVRLFNPFCCLRNGFVSKFAGSIYDYRRVNRRMHNKLFIADGVMAVAGGRNIADEYFMRSTSENFVDMDLFVVGALVPQLATIFDEYWNSAQVYPVEQIIDPTGDAKTYRRQFDELVDDDTQMTAVDLPPLDVLGYGPINEDLDAGRLGLIWGKAVAFADPPWKVSESSSVRSLSVSVTMDVLDRITHAEKEVVISSPYLIPGPTGVQIFTDLGARKVKVTILTNSLAATDEPLVHTGYARYREAMLRGGVDLYELSPILIQRNKRLGFIGSSLGRLHAKTVVIDRSVVFIGSMNLDPRSASRNTELGMIIDSPALAKEVLRVINISKLQSAYRVRFGPDQRTLEWLGFDDDVEVVLTSEPDTTFLTRLQSMLLAPFVPESEL
ncbi:MAG: phospholipase D family protein [Betaproteobacteria bacterium]